MADKQATQMENMVNNLRVLYPEGCIVRLAISPEGVAMIDTQAAAYRSQNESETDEQG